MRSQRNAIDRAVGDAPASSLLLISDVDELVMPALVRLLKACEGCASRRPSPSAIAVGHLRRPLLTELCCGRYPEHMAIVQRNFVSSLYNEVRPPSAARARR
jgi:hypothetical protein